MAPVGWVRDPRILIRNFVSVVRDVLQLVLKKPIHGAAKNKKINCFGMLRIIVELLVMIYPAFKRLF